jgi:hypothetical protein
MLLLRTAVADELNRFGEAVPALIADRVSAEVGARASALEQAFAARIGAAAAAAAAPGFQESRAPLRAEVAAKERELAHIKNRVLAMNSVHRYAVLLELDGAGLVPRRLLEARTTPLEFPPPAEPDVPEIPLDTLKSWDAYGADRSSGSPRIKAAALLVATMLVCSAAYMWWERPQPQAVAHAVPPAAPRQAAPPPAIATPVTPAAEPALANTTPSTTSSPAKPAAKPRSVAAASRAHRTTRRTKPVRRKGPVPPASLPRVQPTKPTAPPAASPPGGPRDKGTP